MYIVTKSIFFPFPAGSPQRCLIIFRAAGKGFPVQTEKQCIRNCSRTRTISRLSCISWFRGKENERIGIIAIPTGIIPAGFSSVINREGRQDDDGKKEDVKQEDEKKYCPYCGHPLK